MGKSEQILDNYQISFKASVIVIMIISDNEHAVITTCALKEGDR